MELLKAGETNKLHIHLTITDNSIYYTEHLWHLVYDRTIDVTSRKFRSFDWELCLIKFSSVCVCVWVPPCLKVDTTKISIAVAVCLCVHTHFFYYTI